MTLACVYLPRSEWFVPLSDISFLVEKQTSDIRPRDHFKLDKLVQKILISLRLICSLCSLTNRLQLCSNASYIHGNFGSFEVTFKIPASYAFVT